MSITSTGVTGHKSSTALQVYIDNTDRSKQIASSALSLAPSSSSSNQHSSSFNFVAPGSTSTPTRSFPGQHLEDSTDLENNNPHSNKKRRLCAAGDQTYNIQVTLAPGATLTGLSMFNNQ